jgi:hypothetical protein
MERQGERLEPLSHRIEEATSVLLMLEAGDQIVCVAHDDHVAPTLAPALLALSTVALPVDIGT